MDLGLTRLTTQSLMDNQPISPISFARKLVELVILSLRVSGTRVLQALGQAALRCDITRSTSYRTWEIGDIWRLYPRERVVNP